MLNICLYMACNENFKHFLKEDVHNWHTEHQWCVDDNENFRSLIWPWSIFHTMQYLIQVCISAKVPTDWLLISSILCLYEHTPFWKIEVFFQMWGGVHDTAKTS